MWSSAKIPQHMWQLVNPVPLGIIEATFETLENDLICGFGLSVGQRMFYRKILNGELRPVVRGIPNRTMIDIMKNSM